VEVITVAFEKRDIVSYNGPNDVFVWKSPREDFTTNTWIEVQESQEAILFHNGQALDRLPSGSYQLEEQKIPLIAKLLGYTPGKPLSFHAAIYFFNMAVNMDMAWGTAPPIPLEDPKYQVNGQGITVHVGANGQFSVGVADSRKLLVKLVGTMPVLTRMDLERHFKGMLNNISKTVIAETMIRERISVREVAMKQMYISNEIKAHLLPSFEEYGLTLRNFDIIAIGAPSNDPGLAMINSSIGKGYANIIEATARSNARAIEGYSYHEERAFDNAKIVADKGAYNSTQPPLATGVIYCSKCGRVIPTGSKFCAECGMPIGGKAFCRECGKEIPAGSRFCPHCGEQQVTVC
jgi:membrane protease subunit (stomatin/prohibitin family)